MEKITIGILGYGRFGKLLQQVFSSYWPEAVVRMYSHSHPVDGIKFYTLAETVHSDILIPCVPISAFKQTLQEAAPYLLKNKTTVIDICSVKVYPTEAMQQVLGPNSRLISTHPMFGPDSSKQGTQFQDLTMMMYNLSAPESVYEMFKSFWENLGVKVVEMTPDQHDKYAAYTINYNHLIGRIGELVGIKPTPIDTKGFTIIYQGLQYVVNDSWELFKDMQNYNPYASEMRRKVREALDTIEQRLKS